jgi:hypothetical protein
MLRDFGACRRYPPSIPPGNGTAAYLHPLVTLLDACGEFQAAPLEARMMGTPAALEPAITMGKDASVTSPRDHRGAGRIL